LFIHFLSYLALSFDAILRLHDEKMILSTRGGSDGH
jgi:phage protein D